MSTVIYKHINMFNMQCSQFYIACDLAYVNLVFSSSNSYEHGHMNITNLYATVGLCKKAYE